LPKPHAIIVGFGPGNGLGIGGAFGLAGFSLSLIARNPNELKDEILALIQAGSPAEAFTADAGDAIALADAIRRATEIFGPAEVIVYNVLASSQGRPSAIDPGRLTQDFGVNVSGALTSVRAVLPEMLRRGKGTILFTGGGWAIYPSVDFASASLGKCAQRMLALLLAEELQGTGVRAGTLTIMGSVRRNTPFDPDRIGEAFVDMYRQPTSTFQAEVQFTGDKQS
jgi:NAD(P)-dependent dehydrogenase (short-subunit alcohol dehydrogenase family)